jgi:enoyl-CoA hydratase/carnithine racemase
MTGEAEAAVRTEIDGNLAIITMARADAMNAVNDALRIGMVSACERAANDPDVRAVLIRAEGERAFCVGADIKEVRPALSQAESRTPPADRDYTTAIAAMTKPVVVAIHGFCLGAGLEIALAGDIRIASAASTFGLPEVNLGLIPGAGGTQRLTKLIGIGRAIDMMLTGERVSAERALDWGIITRLVADRAELDAVSLKLAQGLAGKAPIAIAYLKEAVMAGVESGLTTGLARERDLFTLLKATEDSREAAEAFKAKRAPVFRGR